MLSYRRVQRGSGCMFESDRAERCRLKAEECRELAKRARDPETRDQLLALVAEIIWVDRMNPGVVDRRRWVLLVGARS